MENRGAPANQQRDQVNCFVSSLSGNCRHFSRRGRRWQILCKTTELGNVRGVFSTYGIKQGTLVRAVSSARPRADEDKRFFRLRTLGGQIRARKYCPAPCGKWISLICETISSGTRDLKKQGLGPARLCQKLNKILRRGG